MDLIIEKLLTLPGIIIGLSFHEAAHARVSYMLGDPTPKQQGRLTLNPISHIDPIGFIALIICGFGWGKPVQINPNYYKHKRRDEFLVSIAGVTTNLILAIVFAFVSGAVFRAYTGSGSLLMENLFYMFYYVVVINVGLMVFNLIPVPPLDGFGLITKLFNLEKYDWFYKVYQYGALILMVLIVFNLTDFILLPAVQGILRLLMNITF